MRISRSRLAGLLAVTFFLLTASVGALAQNPAQMVPNGQKLKIQGIVIDRNADLFRVRDTSNVGNSDGQLVAKTVKFDEQDLRTAQALQQTDEMTRENAARIAAEEKARKEEAQKLAGQIAENQALTAQAQASADAANARAAEAQKAADRANNRINGLGNYDQIRNWTIYFRPGSAVLSLAEKQKIDMGVVWVRAQPNTDAWFVSITGFADTRGNTAYNRSLSERRANAVIGYLVAKHNLPLTRLIQPFGYGESKPVADNTTAEGRAKNRRVEIKILQNKGISGTN